MNTLTIVLIRKVSKIKIILYYNPVCKQGRFEQKNPEILQLYDKHIHFFNIKITQY